MKRALSTWLDRLIECSIMCVLSFSFCPQLSVCKNQLFRMYGVCRLHHLQQLHLAYNGILTIEGMKELSQLRHLNLEGNNIKAIEHLTTNCKLEFLNLAENSIASISDLSYLKCLKVRIANILPKQTKTFNM